MERDGINNTAEWSEGGVRSRGVTGVAIMISTWAKSLDGMDTNKQKDH